jgi:hypothetical protein
MQQPNYTCPKGRKIQLLRRSCICILTLIPIQLVQNKEKKRLSGESLEVGLTITGHVI